MDNEDIKILEEFINYKNINNSPYHLIAISHESLCEAIENLIARYKELKEENKELLLRLKADGLIDRDRYWLKKIKEIEDKNIQIAYGGRRYNTEGIVIKDYISKSKVKEKIEDLKDVIQYSANPLAIDNCKYAIEILQELLEES